MEMTMKKKKKMSLLFLFICLFLLMRSPLVTFGQQEYIGANQTDCSGSYLVNGYSCNNDLNTTTSCSSFLTFRSNPPYDTPAAISDLLASDPSDVALTNNISSVTAKIPSGQLVVVPVSCLCSGSISQHGAQYTFVAGDTYYLLAKVTFQGLTTCRAMMSQNSYDPLQMLVGSKLLVPLRCACPSQNQLSNGTSILVTYLMQENETLDKIGNTFGGVTVESIMEANMLSANTIIYAFTTILVPLRLENCAEKPGSFYCQCPTGYHRVGSLGNYRCIKDHGKKFPVKWVSSIGVGIGVSLVLFSLILYLRLGLKKRQAKALKKKKMFEQNGGLILQQKLASFRNTDKARIFASEELERATDNYSRSRILGQGAHGTVYKGMLEDGTIVAVKRSKALDNERIEQYINEVVILSQINHRNIVNLLGCCLETKVPILVYEYISNGTLSSHIHRNCEPSLSWEDRFRVLCEVAGAVAYMHSAASAVPIYHRDIKPSNILLDDNFIAKVSDFGTSRLVPCDKTHMTTILQGTFGYLDPEFFQSSQFTDKSDVYSFGVVLVELLTGEKPGCKLCIDDEDQGRNMVANFVSMMKSDRLLETLHPRVVKEARYEVIVAVAMLGLRCLRLNGKKRPSMKEVAMELEGLRKSQKSLEIHGGGKGKLDLDDEEEDESFYIDEAPLVGNSRSFSLHMESTTIPR